MTQHTFNYRSEIKADARELFAWHARAGAFERLSPPWENVRLRDRSGTIKDGDTVDLEVKLGLVPLRWRARHQDYVEGTQFCDVQEGGPFKFWKHVHSVSGREDRALLVDTINYQLPLSPLSDWIAGRIVRQKLDRLFSYRHRTTRDDLAAHSRFAGEPPLSIGITGASGLVGRSLTPFLTTGGHRVHVISRNEADPIEGPAWRLDPSLKVDAVVHLAGEPIDGRWTDMKRQLIRRSRVEGTTRLIDTLLARPSPPRTIVCASTVGYYGDRGDELLTESSGNGDGFLSNVCHEWEGASARAVESGMRVVHLRFGVVLCARGGALARMLPPFRLGVGGRIGTGSQFMSWIAIDDAVGAIHHALCDDELAGPVNVVSPNPECNRSFAKVLGRVLGRPTFGLLPAFAIKAAIGETANTLLLPSTRCSPGVLKEHGYRFRYPDLEDALKFQLGRMLSKNSLGSSHSCHEV